MENGLEDGCIMKKCIGKISNKFRAIILQWLGLEKVDYKIETQRRAIVELQSRMDIVFSAVHVGVDYNPRYGGSWAIVCLDGKEGQSFIQCYNLSKKDIREIQDFLKYFERRNVTIDAPFGIKKNDFFGY
ncbi:hypothetical protein [Mucilaginibacter rubeus]|uniref:Uncharacterized protein n=1 Tax=Mucilaginibacter rubeus TaxID=2027860 RepID=A0A5C1I5S9_9SPHI|nr:hypothetical protein [Mucilaginibacter rubeus]QEM13457.1 hypothetical protein DEO27_026755 [Mucilaginibacter rubeus]